MNYLCLNFTFVLQNGKIIAPQLTHCICKTNNFSVEPKEAEFVPLLSSIQEKMGTSVNQNVAVDMDKMGPTDIPHR